VSYRCSACEVNWRPYQVDYGQCPMCGADSTSTKQPVSDDADLLYRIAVPIAKRKSATPPSVLTATTSHTNRTRLAGSNQFSS
jgi:hypothetical protein